MNCDRISIDNPPEYPTRYEHDDAPIDMDSFKLSVEEKERIDRASQWGRSLILSARAGDPQALQNLQTKMHMTVYQVMR